MIGFAYRDGELFCENVPVGRLVAEFGSPAYIYSETALTENYRAVHSAFNAYMSSQICFSVKSCSNINILRLFANIGAGFDIVSGGELFRVKQTGATPDKIVFAGVGKTAKEIGEALDAGILAFNCESEAEVFTINEIAKSRGKIAPVSLRVNPDIDAKTHRKTTTAKKENKFGIAASRVRKLLKEIPRLPNVVLRGVDVHLGSPINSLTPYEEAVEKLSAWLRGAPDTVEFIDIGGGFGLTYRNETPPTFAEYAKAIAKPLAATGKKLLLEPGRSLVGNAAILAAEIQYVKSTDEKTFYLLDAGMNDLIRPAMYDAYHFIWAVNSAENPPSPLFGNVENAGVASSSKKLRGLIKADVAGPICESGDVFAKKRPLPPMVRGDKVAIFSAGAYGFSMSSNYNSRPRPVEILVTGDKYRVIRRRESYEDLVRDERAER